jgi:hypothetical protein
LAWAATTGSATDELAGTIGGPIVAAGTNQLARAAGERANKLAIAAATGRPGAAGGIGAAELAKPAGAGHVFALIAS